jgi:hypothetical protein
MPAGYAQGQHYFTPDFFIFVASVHEFPYTNHKECFWLHVKPQWLNTKVVFNIDAWSATLELFHPPEHLPLHSSLFQFVLTLF